MEETVVKKRKGPLFWVMITSVFWLIILISCIITTGVILASNEQFQSYFLDRVKDKYGIEQIVYESDVDPEVTPTVEEVREQELLDEIQQLKEKVREYEIREEVKNELSATVTPTINVTPEITMEDNDQI